MRLDLSRTRTESSESIAPRGPSRGQIFWLACLQLQSLHWSIRKTLSERRACCAEEGGQAGSTMGKVLSSMRLDLSRARMESGEGIAPGGLPEDSLWLDQDASDITLITLHLLSQWLLQAPQSCRQAKLACGGILPSPNFYHNLFACSVVQHAARHAICVVKAVNARTVACCFYLRPSPGSMQSSAYSALQYAARRRVLPGKLTQPLLIILESLSSGF